MVENVDPTRKKERSDTADPTLAKESTEQVFANRACPRTDNAEER